MSMQMTLWPDAGASTSSREACRASRRVSLANDWDLPTLDGSGPNTSDSSWRFALAGYLLRTCQGFYRSQHPNGCSLIWKKRGTKSSRMLPVLGCAAPRTNGTGSGSSGDWQTMTVTDTRISKARQDWFTPQGRDWKDTGPSQGNRKDVNLGVQAHRCAGPPAPARRSTSGKPNDWRTPTDERRGVHHHPDAKAGQHSLTTQAKGQLNPVWVQSLQGLPDGWLDLPDATLSRLLATRTRRGCPTSSGAG